MFMKHGQPATHILPLREARPMEIPHMDDFPKEVKEIVRDIIATALIRYAEEQEDKEAS
jgi:hypothetical protein